MFITTDEHCHILDTTDGVITYWDWSTYRYKLLSTFIDFLLIDTRSQIELNIDGVAYFYDGYVLTPKSKFLWRGCGLYKQSSPVWLYSYATTNHSSCLINLHELGCRTFRDSIYMLRKLNNKYYDNGFLKLKPLFSNPNGDSIVKTSDSTVSINGVDGFHPYRLLYEYDIQRFRGNVTLESFNISVESGSINICGVDFNISKLDEKLYEYYCGDLPYDSKQFSGIRYGFSYFKEELNEIIGVNNTYIDYEDAIILQRNYIGDTSTYEFNPSGQKYTDTIEGIINISKNGNRATIRAYNKYYDVTVSSLLIRYDELYPKLKGTKSGDILKDLKITRVMNEIAGISSDFPSYTNKILTKGEEIIGVDKYCRHTAIELDCGIIHIENTNMGTGDYDVFTGVSTVRVDITKGNILENVSNRSFNGYNRAYYKLSKSDFTWLGIRYVTPLCLHNITYTEKGVEINLLCTVTVFGIIYFLILPLHTAGVLVLQEDNEYICKLLYQDIYITPLLYDTLVSTFDLDYMFNISDNLTIKHKNSISAKNNIAEDKKGKLKNLDENWR